MLWAGLTAIPHCSVRDQIDQISLMYQWLLLMNEYIMFNLISYHTIFKHGVQRCVCVCVLDRDTLCYKANG